MSYHTQLLTREQAIAAVGAIKAAPIELLTSSDVAAAAQAIAFHLEQTVYDSLYFAAALAERVTLITADQRFAAAAGRHAVYGPAIRLLG